jgi:hypothetical protein
MTARRAPEKQQTIKWRVGEKEKRQNAEEVRGEEEIECLRTTEKEIKQEKQRATDRFTDPATKNIDIS